MIISIVLLNTYKGNITLHLYFSFVNILAFELKNALFGPSNVFMICLSTSVFVFVTANVSFSSTLFSKTFLKGVLFRTAYFELSLEVVYSLKQKMIKNIGTTYLLIKKG